MITRGALDDIERAVIDERTSGRHLPLWILDNTLAYPGSQRPCDLLLWRMSAGLNTFKHDDSSMQLLTCTG
jgi:hypothetical protein